MKKILILCPYSYPSACGIWSRVWSDAKALKAEGYDVVVFSSNVIKGTNQTSTYHEDLEGVSLYRFPVKFSLGGSSMFWDFSEELSKQNPDIIHSHGYRHPHSLFSLILGKLSHKVVVHTTHAPFSKDENRPFIMKMFDNLYDVFLGWWELRLYNQVIRISNWEEKYLINLGLSKSILIPNGVNKKFYENFDQNIFNNDPKKRILYMGRIDPIKRVEWIVDAAAKLPEYNFKVIGPLNGYSDFKSKSSNLEIIVKKYDLSEFISNSFESDIYILASIREALPFTLLEAMSRGMIVISSDSMGGMEVIVNDKNGFIVKSEEELKEKIKEIYSEWPKMKAVRQKAYETALNYSEDQSTSKLLELYKTF